MQQPFQAFMEAQQKMMDYWTEQMQQMTKNAVPESYEGPFREWMNMQQEFYRKMMAGPMMTDVMKDAPLQINKWMKVQLQMAELWSDAFRKTAKEMGATLPDVEPIRETRKLWSEWLDQSKGYLDGEKPVMWFPFFNQYADVYNMLFRYWEPFTRMIRDGVYEEHIIEKYFSRDAYRELIGKMFNIGPQDRWSEVMAKGNHLLEHYIEYMNEVAPTLENTMAVWDKAMEKYAPKGVNPIFDLVSDLNHYIREILDPFYAIAGPRKEIRMLQLMREIQFNYVSFHVKAAELQGMLLEASHLALPDVLEEFSQAFNEKKELPDFPTFFRTFLDKLENRLIQALQSDRYSRLQNEVAKTGVSVKSSLDELVEWSLKGLPVVTKSEEDDIAKEMQALRDRIRHLESEMGELKKTKRKPTRAALEN